MKTHQWQDAGALQWGALGLNPSEAANYQHCALCNTIIDVHYNAGEGLAESMSRLGVPEECPNGIEQPAGGTKIFCFCNGGRPGWYEALAICEDGVVVGQHICSTPGWCKSDLGIGTNNKHEQYAAHCPDGYELVWVDDPRNHAGLQAAYALNQELAKETKEVSSV